jgi:hypothetical protein
MPKTHPCQWGDGRLKRKCMKLYPIIINFKKSFTMVFQMLMCGKCYENVYT